MEDEDYGEQDPYSFIVQTAEIAEIARWDTVWQYFEQRIKQLKWAQVRKNYIESKEKLPVFPWK